jgi:acyl carrier protein
MAIDRAAFLVNFASGLDGVDASSLTQETAFRELEVWDSLAVLATLAMVDSEYGVSLAATELKPCRTIGDLATLVDSKATAR